MSYLLLTINHTTAAISLRNQVVVVDAQHIDIFAQLKQYGVIELVIISTCNRTELYIWHADDAANVISKTLAYMASLKSIDAAKLKAHTQIMRDNAVIQHLVKTAAGFMSMIVGETQIFGQIKNAYVLALRQGMTGRHLNVLFQMAFHYAKNIRTKSGVGKDSVSLAAAVAKLCGHIFSANNSHSFLLIGAGETMRIVVEHLNTMFKTSRFIICNRSIELAEALAKRTRDGSAKPLPDVPYLLTAADIVICATSYTGEIISQNMVKNALIKAKRNLQLYIDLSVPININPDIQKIDSVYYYNIDAVSQVIKENIATRTSIADQYEEHTVAISQLINQQLPSNHKRKRIADFYTNMQKLLESKGEDKTTALLLHRISKLLNSTTDMQELERIIQTLLQSSK